MKNDYRYEIKFVLDEASLTTAYSWIYNHTSMVERYSRRSVNSLYFDDVDFSSVRDNLAGISNRKKIRLRWYDDCVSPILETKIRDGRLGYKKSEPIIGLSDNFFDLSIENITFECFKKINSEYIIPTLQTTYDREYYQDIGDIRITIDKNISFYSVNLHQKLNNLLPVSYHNKIMEIKFSPDKKIMVANMLRSLHLTPKRHSKYLQGLSKLGYVVYI